MAAVSQGCCEKYVGMGGALPNANEECVVLENILGGERMASGNAEESSAVSSSAKWLKKLSSGLGWKTANCNKKNGEILATAAAAAWEAPQTRAGITSASVRTSPKHSGDAASSSNIPAASTDTKSASKRVETSPVSKEEDPNPISSTFAIIKKLPIGLMWDKWSSWSKKNGGARGTRAPASPSDRLLPFINLPTENPNVIVASSSAPAKNSDANLAVRGAIINGSLKAGLTVSADTLSIPARAKTTPAHEAENSEQEFPAMNVLVDLSGQPSEAYPGISCIARAQGPDVRKTAAPSVTQLIVSSEILAAAAQVQAAALQVKEAAVELQEAATEVQKAATQVKEVCDETAKFAAAPIDANKSRPYEMESREPPAIDLSQLSDHSPSSQLIKKMSSRFNMKRWLNLVPSPGQDAKFQRAFSPVSSGSSNGEDDQAEQIPRAALARNFGDFERVSASQSERHGGTLMRKLTTKLGMKKRSGIRGHGNEARLHRNGSRVSDGSTESGKRTDGEAGHSTFDQKTATAITDSSGRVGFFKVLSGRLVGRFMFHETSSTDAAVSDCGNPLPGSNCAAPVVPGTCSGESREPYASNKRNVTLCSKFGIENDMRTVSNTRKTPVSSSTRIAKASMRFRLLEGLTNAYNASERPGNESNKEKVKDIAQLFEPRLESAQRHDGQEKRLSVRELIERFEALASQTLPQTVAIDAAAPLEESFTENGTIETGNLYSVVDSRSVGVKINTSSPEDFRFVCSPIHVDSFIMG